MDFYAIACEKFIDKVSDSTPQSTFLKIMQYQKYPQLSEKAIKILLQKKIGLPT